MAGGTEVNTPTLRDIFAAAALTGILASTEEESVDVESLSTIAWAMADEMLAQREDVRP